MMAERSAKRGPGKTKLTHVLLMEDETTVAQLIRLHLQGRGFSVDIAENGEKGLKMLDAGYFDVLIIDQRMPELSGLEVIHALKERGALPPILMMSALGLEDVAVEALKLGAMDYVIKDPAGKFLEKLPTAIEEVLKRHRAAEDFRQTQEDRNRWLHELKQRIKELGCLYGIEKLLSAEGGSLDVVLQSIANLVPHASRYDTLCWARIRLDDKEFRSDNYLETPWSKSLALKKGGQPIGWLDVGYREKPPVPEHELFSPEEQELLHAISDRLSGVVTRWRTQEVLQTTHEELRKLSRAVEQSASGIVVTNVRGAIEYVNPRFTEMTGYGSHEVIGKNPRILKSGEMMPEAYAELWKTIASGREWRGEFHNRKKNGQLYWDYSTISPITNSQGILTHFVAVKEDITQQKEVAALQTAVLTLSAEIAGSQTEDEISRVVVEGVRKRMAIDRCGLFLGDPNHPPFRGTYGTDLNGGTTDETHYLWDIGKDRDVADLFAGRMYKTGFPLGAPEAMPGEEGLTSTLIALRQGGAVFGVISVDNRISRRPVTEAQMMHIALLAEVLGNALQVARAREALRASVEEARHANEELEKFNRAMVGRENRIIELKEEINRLLAERGQAPRYAPVWNRAGEEAAPDPAKKKK
ncbi:MAG: response regulator [Verrucomicrobiota bacterium]